jgi:hypothetical protein
MLACCIREGQQLLADQVVERALRPEPALDGFRGPALLNPDLLEAPRLYRTCRDAVCVEHAHRIPRRPVAGDRRLCRHWRSRNLFEQIKRSYTIHLGARSRSTPNR